MNTGYKYKPIPEEDKTKITFLKVIKPLFWVGRPDKTESQIPVGAITWVANGFLVKNEITKQMELNHSLCPENNRYTVNYDPSCFEVLHTTIQKIK